MSWHILELQQEEWLNRKEELGTQQRWWQPTICEPEIEKAQTLETQLSEQCRTNTAKKKKLENKSLDNYNLC